MRTKDKTFLMLQRYNNICKKLGLVCNVDLEIWRDILDYFGHSCCYCGETENLVLGFIIPYSKNGDCVYGNVICCCNFHRYSKHNRLLEEWLQFDVIKKYYPQKIIKLNEYINKYK